MDSRIKEVFNTHPKVLSLSRASSHRMSLPDSGKECIEQGVPDLRNVIQDVSFAESLPFSSILSIVANVDRAKTSED